MKKSTEELLKLMQTSHDYSDYQKKNREDMNASYMKLDRALCALINRRGLKKADVIARSGLETHYGYQILSGVKTPTRDKVVMLCFGMGLSPEETQELLKTTGYPALYARAERDNALLFGLTKKFSIVEVNTLLYDLGMELLE